jgi:hypothetical protein
MPSFQGLLPVLAQGLSVVTAITLLGCTAIALLFVYRAVRMLLTEKVQRVSIGVRVFSFIRVDLNFGDHDDEPALADEPCAVEHLPKVASHVVSAEDVTHPGADNKP